MRVYYFNRINAVYRSEFYNYSTLQNLKAAKTLSLVYFLVSLAIRIFGKNTHFPYNDVPNIHELVVANFISTAVTPVFYFGSLLLIRYFEKNSSLKTVSRLFVLLFALFIITNGMRVTFLVMHNPRNTLVMYLAALTVTGIFFTFEYFETLFIVAVVSAIFMSVVPYFQHTFSERLINDLVSFVLMVLFFLISRYLFSYRADNYLKLKAIEEKNMEIENASRLKNEILGIVAHDLRNPLTSINAIADIMENDPALTKDNQENIRMIKASYEKATYIISDLIETAHNDKDGTYDIEEVELNQYLLKIVDEWVKNRTTTVNLLYYGTQQPIYTHINLEKMQRVMDNLISNAIKFSAEGGNIMVTLREQDDRIFIDVKDFGAGIPENLLPYIFDRFSRASRRGLRGEESIGLGLSIVKQIVKKHGGDIEVKSVENEGTTFTINMTPIRISNKAKA